MNFIDERSLRSAVARRGISLPASAKSTVQLLVKVNSLAYRIGKTALDAACTMYATGTLQANVFDDIARLHALLMAPVLSSKQGQYGGEVLPGTYFGGPQSAAFSRTGGGSDGLARQAMVHTPMTMSGGAPDYTLPQVYFGGPESAAYSSMLPPPLPVDAGFARNALTSTFPASQLLMGGGGATGLLTEDAVDRIIKEYKARHGRAMRITDGARHRLRQIINANVIMACVAATQSKKKTSSLNLAGFNKVTKRWTLQL